MAVKITLRESRDILLFILSVPALAVAIIVGALVLFARPPALVCSSGAFVLLASCLLSGPVWAKLTGRRRAVGLEWGAAQLVFAVLLLMIVLPFQLIAKVRADVPKAANDAEQIARLIAKEGNADDLLAERRDPFGGRYHVRKDGTGALIVWCDGPDLRDDGGRSLPRDWFLVHGSFSACYARSLHWIERAVYRCVALEVLGREEPTGDIVFKIAPTGSALPQIPSEDSP